MVLVVNYNIAGQAVVEDAAAAAAAATATALVCRTRPDSKCATGRCKIGRLLSQNLDFSVTFLNSD